MKVKVNFIIGQVSEGDFDLLHQGEKVTCKMILGQADFSIFHYQVNDQIEVENSDGNRLWCKILQLEKIQEGDQILLIFNLQKA